MEFIHGKGIIHRDLKLENIFLRRVGKGRYVCKIGDFGLARPIDGEETAFTNCGTESYMAPEILKGRPYGKQADVWSLGVLYYYLLMGDFPFKGINLLDQISTRCANGFTLAFPLPQQHPKSQPNSKDIANLGDFFGRVFEPDPTSRITIRQMLVHPLLKRDNDMA